MLMHIHNLVCPWHIQNPCMFLSQSIFRIQVIFKYITCIGYQHPVSRQKYYPLFLAKLPLKSENCLSPPFEAIPLLYCFLMTPTPVKSVLPHSYSQTTSKNWGPVNPPLLKIWYEVQLASVKRRRGRGGGQVSGPGFGLRTMKNYIKHFYKSSIFRFSYISECASL